ncbi:Variant-specific surface protein [Giardia duodenalis]|uniref:Variant-specific surface protein n=1 Tax=Giardia intestinalis TaxID=5741 RepID=V6TF48_GIAIN|nr:Variant-specific surface protein [Giardia intestinalis]
MSINVFILLVGLALHLATEECTSVSSDQPDTCKACDAVINGKKYCSQCNGGGFDQASPAPTDGVCSPDNAVCNAKAEGKCTTCTGSSFMYKGGCYKDSQAPGNTMCEATDGVCTRDKAGYFVLPGADASHQSVIPCGDDTVVTVSGDKKYKGVLHCTQCNTPDPAQDTNTAKAATCTTCEDGYFVDSSKGCTACDGSCKTCEATGDTKCKSCTEETHFLGAASGQAGKCISCGDASGSTWKGVDGCLKCTASGNANTLATCTECQEGKYLKTGNTPSCVSAEECTGGFFPTTDTSGKKVCAPCNEADKGGIADCAKCSLKAASARAGPLITCSECITNNLSPLKDACLTDCPAGMYANNKVYTPCHELCAGCQTDDKETSCTACYPGFILVRAGATDKGTCVRECTGAAGTGCESNMCNAKIAGSNYCPKCVTGQAPINGICTSVTRSARDAVGCAPSDGKCTACIGGYFLQFGGCYEKTQFPGKMVCTDVDSQRKCNSCLKFVMYILTLLRSWK